MASSLSGLRSERPTPTILNAGFLLCRFAVGEGATGSQGAPHQQKRPEQE
jgi:hypothetical protein